MDDFEAAIDRAVAGLEKNRVMNAKKKETVAYHEAGHTLIAELRATTDKVSKVSIIPRGISALGFTQQLPTEDRYLMKQGELLDRLDVLLAGQVAEQLIFGEISTGARNDLQRATDLVRHMVTQYGMSEALGAAVLEVRPAGYAGDIGMSSLREYSEGHGATDRCRGSTSAPGICGACAHPRLQPSAKSLKRLRKCCFARRPWNVMNSWAFLRIGNSRRTMAWASEIV